MPQYYCSTASTANFTFIEHECEVSFQPTNTLEKRLEVKKYDMHVLGVKELQYFSIFPFYPQHFGTFGRVYCFRLVRLCVIVLFRL